ncbi:hypothetical protein JCM10212_003213 [Sporobolomyces blumeae]
MPRRTSSIKAVKSESEQESASSLRVHPSGTQSLDRDEDGGVEVMTPDIEAARDEEHDELEGQEVEEEDDDGEAEESSQSAAEADSQGFWKALEIMDETATQYRIRWAGKDEHGQPWAPTWEPKRNANQQLVQEWKKNGRRQHKERKEREKREKAERKKAARMKKKGKKPQAASRPTGKGKAAALKAESPEVELTPDIDLTSSRETIVSTSLDEDTFPLVRPISRKRAAAIPDSDQGSPEATQSLATGSDAWRKSAQGEGGKGSTKRVTFELVVDSGSRNSEASPSQAPGKRSGEEKQAEIDESDDVEMQLASSAESSHSIVPDSQMEPTSAKGLGTASPPLSPGLAAHGSPDFVNLTEPEPHADSFAVRAGPPVRSQRVLVAMESPATSHSELSHGSAHGDDDVPIFNDLSQQEGDEPEYYEPPADLFNYREDHHHGRSAGSSIASTSMNAVRSSNPTMSGAALGRCPVPPAAAFFRPAESHLVSSQFDPIEDPDSPRRSQISRRDTGRAAYASRNATSPIGAGRDGCKTRLELQLGPPSDDLAQLAAYTTGAERRLARSSVAQPTQSVVQPMRPAPSRIKRPVFRPAAISLRPVAVGSDGTAEMGPTTALGGWRDDTVSDAGSESPASVEFDAEKWNAGGVNDDIFAEGLDATQLPPARVDEEDEDFAAYVDYDQGAGTVGETGEPSASNEAGDAGEGGYGSGHAGSNGGHYPSYPTQQSTAPSHYPDQRGEPSSSMAYAPSGGQGGGYPGYGGASGGGHPTGNPYSSHSHYTSHAQPMHPVKREYPDDRDDESAKRARTDEQQRQQYALQQHQLRELEQQQQQHRQQQQQYQAQQYATAFGHTMQSQSPYQHYAAPSRPTPPSSHHQQYSPPPQQSAQYRSGSAQPQPQRTELPPMQQYLPAASTSSYGSNQLPPIQQVLSATSARPNVGHAPPTPSRPTAGSPAPPSVSAAAASPAPPATVATGLSNTPSAGHLASPSIARVQNTEPYKIPNPAQPAAAQAGASTSQRSPSPGLAKAQSAAAPAPIATPAQVSRVSSPAPSLSAVEDLVALVKASTKIEDSDNTKAEIEKFLRDPRGYADIPERPLSASPFWAFELRRQSLDSGEKVDFVILHTREGKYQLKRCAASNIPVEFARSLKHAPARERGLTPAVDAVPTLHASSAASATLPSPSSMTREQLEAEFESMRQRLAASETELATLRPLAAETVKLRTEVQALMAANKQLKNSRDLVQQDMTYMQDQYSVASTAAMERAQEARVAEAEAERLNGLLRDGLAQKENLYKAELKRWKLEVERMKIAVKLAKVERSKLDELDVKRKAARWDEAVARRDAKRATEEARRKRLEEGGAADGQEDDEDLDSEEEVVSNMLLRDRKPSSTPPRSSTPSEPTLLVTKATMPDPSPLESTQASTATLDESGEFRCAFRDETQPGPDSVRAAAGCGAVFPTKRSLLEHTLSHAESHPEA